YVAARHAPRHVCARTLRLPAGRALFPYTTLFRSDTYRFDADLALGSDTVDESGGGVDLLDFSATTTRAVSIDLSNPAAQVVNAGLTLTLSSGATIENVTGGTRRDSTHCPTPHNALRRARRADKISGAARNDIHTGVGGTALLIGGAGYFSYCFGADLDLRSFPTRRSSDLVDLLDFSATTTRSVSIDLSNPAAQVVNAGLTLTLSSGTTVE